jgi:hypothetical protein
MTFPELLPCGHETEASLFEGRRGGDDSPLALVLILMPLILDDWGNVSIPPKVWCVASCCWEPITVDEYENLLYANELSLDGIAE